jgi:diacylglycerol kinase family enzyme
VLPAGTGNDVARLLGVVSPAHALAALAGGAVVPWDVIEIECQGVDGHGVRRHALLFAGAGFVGDVIRQTTPNVKAWCGSTLSYAVGFFRALARHHATHLKIRGPDFEYEGPLLAALAANAPHAGGGGMRLGPGARMDDGEFNVSVIRSVTRSEVARQFLRLTRGTHVHHHAVSYFPATWLSIESERPLDVVADGELIGTTPARLTLRPGGVQLCSAQPKL